MARTKGSRNGISTTPGYEAVGKVAEMINGTYASQLARRSANATSTTFTNAAPKRKPTFSVLNTPIAAQQYMQWERRMAGQREAATKNAAQKQRAYSNAVVSRNHNITKGYTGNPTSQIQAQKHATNASYYKPAKMSSGAYYNNAKTKLRSTASTLKEPEYVDPYREAYEKSGLVNKFKGTYNSSKGDYKKAENQDFEKFKRLLDNPNYDFGPFTNDNVRKIYNEATTRNTQAKSDYQKAKAIDDAGARQAQLAQNNALRRRNAEKEKAINDAFERISRMKRADKIRRSKAIIDDPDRGKRSTFANVVRDLRDDTRSLGGAIRRKIRRR